MRMIETIKSLRIKHMKNRNQILTLAILGLITACNFSTSVSKDLMTGLSTKGDGLSADEVYISNGDDRITDNTFVYGNQVFTNFENMDGFVIENGKIYPEMQVVVVSKAGDTVLQNANLLGGKAIEGVSANLNGNVTLAAPIYSGDTYLVKYTVTDTKGDGVFTSELELELERDSKIKLNESGLSIKEAYLFNQENRTVITNGQIGFENNVLLDLQGLSGYELLNGSASLGMFVKVIDAKGKVILDLPDLLENRELTETQIQKGLGSTVIIQKGMLANPITWEVKVWDKNSGATLTVKTEVQVK